MMDFYIFALAFSLSTVFHIHMDIYITSALTRAKTLIEVSKAVRRMNITWNRVDQRSFPIAAVQVVEQDFEHMIDGKDLQFTHHSIRSKHPRSNLLCSKYGCSAPGILRLSTKMETNALHCVCAGT